MRYINHIRAHREARSLTQWDVAKVVDIHLNRYGRMEKGVVQPAYAEGVRLAEFFGVTPEELFPVHRTASA
jgi:DNA-binding XRE family transcriptional regulator